MRPSFPSQEAHPRPLPVGLVLAFVACAFLPQVALSESALDRAKRELSAIQSSDLPQDDERSAIERAWSDTIQAILDEQRWRERESESLGLAADAPRLLKETQLELALPTGGIDESAIPTDLAALELQLAQAQARKAGAEQLIQELQLERRRRTDRSLSLPGELNRLRQQLEVPSADAAGLAPAGMSASLSAALRALAEAREPLLAAELAAREAELLSYEARSVLLTARQDLSVRRAYEATRSVELLSERVGRLRNEAADAASLEAEALRKRLEASPKIVQELAAENESLAGERRKHLMASPGLAIQNAELAAQADEVIARSADVTRRVEAARFTKPVALLMRRHRDELPEIGRNRAQLRARQRVETDLLIRQLDVESARADLTDLDAAVAGYLRSLEAQDGSELETGEVQEVLHDLLLRQRSLLDELHAELGRQLTQLVELDGHQERLIEATESYGEFIDERLLWLRESSVFGLRQLKDLGGAITWLAAPSRWAEFFGALSVHLRERPTDLLLVFLLVLPSLIRRRALKRLDAIGGELGRSRRHRFRSTLEALACTAIATIVWPAVLAWLARTIGAASAETELGHFVASGLEELARLLLPLILLIDTCRPQGLAHAHFRWPAAQLEAVRDSTWLLASIALPALAAAWTLEGAERADLRDALSRLALLVGLVAFAVFHHRTLDPRRRTGHARRRRDRITHRLATAIPLLLVVVGLLGYSFAARELSQRLVATHALFFLVAVLHAAALRWLLVERRRLRLEALRKAAAEETDAVPELLESAPLADGDDLDLDLVDAQTRQLLRAAAIVTLCVSSWGLWAGFLPATRAAEEVVLWTAQGPAHETAPEATASPMAQLLPQPAKSAAPESVERRVTLLDVLLAIAVCALALLAASNVPGLLEIAVLRRLDLQPGTGYAITTLTRYALTIGGLFAAAGWLGISWSSVQWLAAAVTVGLGFGLQEIFANFVSGLIILFERPIRVGDIVTVGGIEGQVTRIRTRATTIRDWNRRELLVPNREFITSQLINWTLTDAITRLVVPVGIAYGSPTREAAALLLAAARGNPLVLAEPAPNVVFRAFGESSLDFELRVFMAHPGLWPQVVHQLHLAIDDAFREAGIEIAFPQRDIHVRTLPKELPKGD